MAKFTLIEKMGLEILEDEYTHKYSINAQHLEAALEKATVIYSAHDDASDIYWGYKKESTDTHKALLINVEEITKEQLKHESVLTCDTYFTYQVPSYFEGKKVKITIEEIKD